MAGGPQGASLEVRWWGSVQGQVRNGPPAGENPGVLPVAQKEGSPQPRPWWERTGLLEGAFPGLSRLWAQIRRGALGRWKAWWGARGAGAGGQELLPLRCRLRSKHFATVASMCLSLSPACRWQTCLLHLWECCARGSGLFPPARAPLLLFLDRPFSPTFFLLTRWGNADLAGRCQTFRTSEYFKCLQHYV